ncbi:MAG: GNAT family N-acetyltransferase [bacterium]
MPVHIQDFQHANYDAVLALWRTSAGVTLRDVDERDPLLAYLDRNPGLSFVALDGESVVGAVLCGTDGRRGYLQHLAVATTHRQRGIGRQLAERCVRALKARGIYKCHLMVVSGNHPAAAFWSRLGWVVREDIQLMSHTTSRSPTA